MRTLRVFNAVGKGFFYLNQSRGMKSRSFFSECQLADVAKITGGKPKRGAQTRKS
jgi:hypothetical protein